MVTSTPSRAPCVSNLVLPSLLSCFVVARLKWPALVFSRLCRERIGPVPDLGQACFGWGPADRLEADRQPCGAQGWRPSASASNPMRLDRGVLGNTLASPSRLFRAGAPSLPAKRLTAVQRTP